MALAYGRPQWDAAGFVARTKIEIPHAAESIVSFDLWPAQAVALGAMERERLVMFLKARQLGLSWLTCAFVLYQCVTRPGQTWLFFSQGQDEADELIRRVAFLYEHHSDRAELPIVTKDNTDEWGWSNRSRVLSRAATKRAGRSFTASGVVLDEFAFMQWGPQVLSAAKPTIDAGGKLFIISSADGQGSPYHQMWLGAEAGLTGFLPYFLPWTAHPGRDAGWRDRIRQESPELTQAEVLREYPDNPAEAFLHAAGLVFDGAWLDGQGGNVTEAAEYDPAGGAILWAVDDGYSGSLDPKTRTFTAESHPRVVLYVQERANGDLCVFDESYAVQTLEPAHITEALGRPYPAPAHAVVDKSAAALKGHLHATGVATVSRAPGVEESIKVLRHALAADAQGRRRILVHPRCKHLRAEFAAYRRTPDGKIVKAFDHGVDSLRYLAWTKRHEAAND